MTKKQPQILLILFAIVLLWSVVEPKSYLTWVLEIVPLLIGLYILIVTYRRFRFTNMVYSIVFMTFCIALVGAHYTFSEVPFFDWIKDTFNQSRNNFDKLGHFSQGFLPALITRELLIRLKILKDRRWMNVFVLSVSIAISVVYELIEWAVAIIAGGTAEAFLGTQGYVWDAQSDLLFAIIGAAFALMAFSKWHDKAIDQVQNEGLQQSF